MTLRSASDHISHLLPNDQPLRIPGAHLGYGNMRMKSLRLCASLQQAIREQQKTSAEPIRSQVDQGVNIGAPPAI